MAHRVEICAATVALLAAAIRGRAETVSGKRHNEKLSFEEVP